MSDKIRLHHLDRRAILYVRQSSSYQVLHNRESRALQYAMRDRLVALGWSEIEIIDDDLGRSAGGGAMRARFERMVAEVCLGKVGAAAAREVSRFARNSHDWQQRSRCVASSTRCRSTRRRFICRATVMIGSFWAKSRLQRWSGPCGKAIGARVARARLRPPRRRTVSRSSRYIRNSFLWFSSMPSRRSRMCRRR